jgi:prepilin-type N-terminal cleavage/methylation domain-containing protein
MLNLPKNKKAFTLIELSIVLIIIGLLVVGISGGSDLIDAAKLLKAQYLTRSSPVPTIKNLFFWAETTLEKSFKTTTVDMDTPDSWKNIIPQLISPDAKVLSVADPATFVEDGVNGLPSLRFVGSTNNTCYETASFNLRNGFSIFVALDIENPANLVNKNPRIISTNQFHNLMLLYGSVPGQWHTQIGLTGHYPNTTANIIDPEFSSAQIYNIDYNGTTQLTSLFTNGVPGPTQTVFVPDSDPTDTFKIGGFLLHDSCYETGNADIGEVIIYKRSLNDSERKEIESYLSKKWNIDLSI